MYISLIIVIRWAQGFATTTLLITYSHFSFCGKLTGQRHEFVCKRDPDGLDTVEIVQWYWQEYGF